MKFLIADDNQIQRLLTGRIIAVSHGTFEEAADWEDAVNILNDKKRQFDHVLCDGFRSKYKEVFVAAQRREIPMTLISGNEDLIREAQGLGIETRLKGHFNMPLFIEGLINPPRGNKIESR